MDGLVRARVRHPAVTAALIAQLLMLLLLLLLLLVAVVVVMMTMPLLLLTMRLLAMFAGEGRGPNGLQGDGGGGAPAAGGHHQEMHREGPAPGAHVRAGGSGLRAQDQVGRANLARSSAALQTRLLVRATTA